MSALQFATQIDAFLAAALEYGLSSLGGADGPIRLETSTRQAAADVRAQPSGKARSTDAAYATLSTRDRQGRQLLVSLGVCSFDYRLVLLFQVDDDAATRAFFGGGEVALDQLGEFVNLVCGSLNRSLQRAYPSTGMSTPFSMSGTCFDHIQILRPDLSAMLSFLLGSKIRLRIAYALSLGRDFAFVESDPVEESSSMGELELF